MRHRPRRRNPPVSVLSVAFFPRLLFTFFLFEFAFTECNWPKKWYTKLYSDWTSRERHATFSNLVGGVLRNTRINARALIKTFASRLIMQVSLFIEGAAIFRLMSINFSITLLIAPSFLSSFSIFFFQHLNNRVCLHLLETNRNWFISSFYPNSRT